MTLGIHPRLPWPHQRSLLRIEGCKESEAGSGLGWLKLLGILPRALEGQRVGAVDWTASQPVDRTSYDEDEDGAVGGDDEAAETPKPSCSPSKVEYQIPESEVQFLEWERDRALA